MRTVLAALLILAALGPRSAAAAHGGTFTMTFDLSAQPAGAQVRLWVPIPVTGPHQRVSELSWSGDYAEAAVHTEPRQGATMLHARWGGEATSRTLTLRFRAEREALLPRNLPAAEAPWNAKAHAAWLGASSRGPTSGRVAELARAITTGRATVVQKAQALYDWTVENMVRDPETRGCGDGDVPALLESKGGKCVDIHSVFVALARAIGVPAREVFGLRQGRDGRTDVTGAQHCWAEFYLPGQGYVPVDPADVRKAMLARSLTLADEETARLRHAYWGGLDAHRIELNRARDLVLEPPQEGPPLNYLMYPYAEVGGAPIDWLAPERFVYRLTWEP
jgi:transglutaminase-like putative cysteine protease